MKIHALILMLLSTSCGDISGVEKLSAKNLRTMGRGVNNAENGLNLYGEGGFYPEPGACDSAHSKIYYCDGYTQRNEPQTGNPPNPTAETESYIIPPPNSVSLQVIGEFNASRPSVVYVHGWNSEGPNKVFSVPNQWARQVGLAGYNLLAFNWAGLSYDSGYGCPGLGLIGAANLPCNAAHQIYKAGTVTDAFLAEYRARFTGYNQTVRLVAHSMGSQVSILSAYRMYKRADFNNVKKPTRIDLVDPFMTPGLGARRAVPYDGQLPPDGQLAPDYRANIVTNFKAGSKCHSWAVRFLWWTMVPANHLSQYCQNEGMAYSLVKDHNVGMIDFNSILAGVTAGDFRNIMLHQSFNPAAFKGNPLAMHVAPLAAYFYSFSPGTPSNGYDASSPDNQILGAARLQAINNLKMSRIQTTGFDTLSFQDDNYR
jgi:pimeloyl-ACP methyl ester carboxylesterase